MTIRPSRILAVTVHVVSMRSTPTAYVGETGCIQSYLATRNLLQLSCVDLPSDLFPGVDETTLTCTRPVYRVGVVLPTECSIPHLWSTVL